MDSTRNLPRFAFMFDANFNRFSNISHALMESMENMANAEYHESLQHNQRLPNWNKNKNKNINEAKNEEEDEEEEDEDAEENENKNNSWFIYRQKQKNQSRGTVDAQYLNVEQRISNMENCMGFVSDMVCCAFAFALLQKYKYN